ncbi:MAG: hypothetical protein US83_C0011G0038 [Candidatus Falkowbacteria bacterium GW2011_GWC2_38_22]|uniref:Uncharacterized protein n=1 Tax=Candidatus Falkowbacteria bacterium GW2011_GWE1_38_31 TaxID=1618638 RepID=A0A0G0K2Z4_9BACT|nr:MAG: hypothetical protein US73_C0009G0038 [Candidatus Falkowbacteria bacterium GW2011_GWF2_38_1205]KKQ60920.1 MAG: hypothetical protein US83_C0011G0038 [Candidatus Falkowbacteria bacterium GW2011_GWC2_38_22]KKQ63038.1 MAG: hypothetical protein US84_C0009G0038 [Candidatus Falkowbacteria bacterium GW2011_GWF1_38_22]KKQ65060.1 MAG: hypothetical protein US87_C0009G0038 [Candidatus Falkowbacteria bacterium GW2011_GWE2_38_254]KKQ69835.1 MAG: hypothetical protein US91_C0009G0038 [Candidatus Falkowb
MIIVAQRVFAVNHFLNLILTNFILYVSIFLDSRLRYLLFVEILE